MKKLLSLFVALFIAAGSVFAAAAAQGTINLVTASVTYSHRYTSGNGILDLMPSMNTYHYVQDIDIYDDLYWAFNLDTRILPGYTYHISYRLYVGEESEDTNFKNFDPGNFVQLYNSSDASDIMDIYPTIQVTNSNTSTAVDLFIRFEPGTDRGNKVSQANYVTIGQKWDTSSLSPFDYDGIYFGLRRFEAIYDYDGSELDAMIAGFSDVKRGLDSVGQKLDDIGDKLDNIQDDVKQGEIDAKEWELEQANQVANDSLDDVDSSLANALDLSGVDTLFSSFLSLMNYEGTDLDFNMPTVKLPQLGEFIPETVLINEQAIPFETWLADPTIDKIIQIINVLSVIGFVVWIIKQFMYWIEFFSANGDVHKLVDEGWGGNSDPYGG